MNQNSKFRIQKGRELRIISDLVEDGIFFYTELNEFDIRDFKIKNYPISYESKAVGSREEIEKVRK